MNDTDLVLTYELVKSRSENDTYLLAVYRGGDVKWGLLMRDFDYMCEQGRGVFLEVPDVFEAHFGITGYVEALYQDYIDGKAEQEESEEDEEDE